MKKKVMLLMLMIPLLFLITIYSVGKVVSLVVDIPVSGINITTQTDNGIISLDMATYADDIYILAEVEPSNARIKDYSISVTGVGDEEAAKVSVGSDGKLILNGTGRAKIIATSNENSYVDSIIVDVISSKVVDFVPSLTDNANLNVTLSSTDVYDYYAEMKGGAYSFSSVNYPNTLSESPVKWYSSNENVLVIDEILGTCKARLSGEVIVTAVNENGVKGRIEKKIKLKVNKTETQSGITVNGTEGGNILCEKENRNVSLFVEIPESFSMDDVSVLGDNVLTCSFVKVAEENNKLRADVKLLQAEDSFISFRVNGKNNTVGLIFADFAFNVFTAYHHSAENSIYQKDGATVAYAAVSDLSDSSVTYKWTSSDSSVLEVLTSGVGANIKANKTGTATLTVTAWRNDAVIGNTVVKEITVIEPVNSLNFTANTASYGIADLLAIGEYSLNGSDYQKSFIKQGLKLNVKGKALDYSGKDVSFVSSNEAVARPRLTLEDFSIAVVGTGKATFTAKWQYADYFGEKVESALTVQAVKDGVNVSNYEELRRATQDGKIVVLQNDVMLGRKGMSQSELQALAYKTATTYDWQYYNNKGETNPPEIYYLVEFKNDVYGNGYEINADYFTRATDEFGTPLLFKGPLNFVAMEPYAAVKGQDNIVFLARTEGITINNVELKGCLDESLLDENGFNLSLLNYTGTTLEIAEDTVVKNCRISNGRTVVRIYGGKSAGGPVVSDSSLINIAEERVVATIESTIITTGREFLLKLGSNRALLNSLNGREVEYQTLKKANGEAYEVYDDSVKNDAYFYDNYVATDVTLKNSVLARSGLFSIGIETHFSGPMLLGGSSFVLQNWRELAATSYASVLRMVGDVKLYDWKELSIVDSSTLIETKQTEGNENFDFLSLDVSAMLKSVSNNRKEYENIITKENGKEYVHSGIAMYGGGLNYSYVDFSEMTSEEYVDYKVNLSILMEGVSDEENALYRQGKLLPLAAGKGDFRFYMYNGSSESNYQKQAVLNGSYNVPAAK